jgi:hypothetical protein
MSVHHEDREDRPKVYLPGQVWVFLGMQTSVVRNVTISESRSLYSWIPARASYRQFGRNDDAVVFGNPTHRPDLPPGFAKDDLTENALNLSARGKCPLTPLARAGKGTGKNKSGKISVVTTVAA